MAETETTAPAIQLTETCNGKPPSDKTETATSPEASASTSSPSSSTSPSSSSSSPTAATTTSETKSDLDQIKLSVDECGAGGDAVAKNKCDDVDVDAGPHNISGYKRHLPPGETDPFWNDQDLPEFEAITERESADYNLDDGIKLAIVFNHRTFLGNRAPERKGTDFDAAAIDATFKSLGFEVKVYTDLKVNEIHSVLLNIQIRRNISCLALFILTHGEEGGLLYAHDSNYKLNTFVIRELLPGQCSSLAGKPKLIFVQACQGMETDDGIKLTNGNRSRHTSTDGAREGVWNYSIPSYTDIMTFTASYEGHYSFRSPSKGSWFIQALCRYFLFRSVSRVFLIFFIREINKSRAEDDLLAILTRVARYVAIFKTSNVPGNPGLDQKKQIPVKQSTLIRNVYLKAHLKPLTTTTTTQASPHLVRPARSGSGAQAADRHGSARSLPKSDRDGRKDKCLCM